jgi:predicted DNA-binding protein
MALTKTRINISVSKQTRDTLRALAKRDQMPVASKVADLVEVALELEEDRMLSAIADARLKSHKGRWLTHEEVWGKQKISR